MDNSRDPLDDDLRDLLATYREAVQPPAASERRIRESLQTSLPAWSTPPQPAAEGVLYLFGSRRRRAIVLACSAAAALTLTFGLSSYLGEQRRRADHQQSVLQRSDGGEAQGRATIHDAGSRSTAVVTRPGRGSDDAPAGEQPSTGDERPSLAPSQSADDPSERDNSRPLPTIPPGRAATAPRPPSSRPSDHPQRPGSKDQAPPSADPADDTTAADPLLDLAEELRLIREAENHLRAGREVQALAAIERHRHKFPKGQLEPEREASRVTALCQQGDPSEAAERARIFAERWPRSPLLPRVRRVCEASATP